MFCSELLYAEVFMHSPEPKLLGGAKNNLSK